MFLNGRIIHVPSNNPESTFGRAQAVFHAANALVQAASVNKELSSELNAAATRLTQEALGQITKGISQGAHAKTA
jgi:hypothetical protein